MTLESIGAAGLKPGDGVVTAFTLSGRPAVAVLGGDEAGLTAASVMLAGHLPYVWDQKGPTTDKIADDVKQFLAGKGLTPSSAVAHAVFVRAGANAADRADRVVVALQMANGGDVIKGQVALNQFKATSARDPRRPLSYANVRSVQVRMRATGMGTLTVDLPRAAGSAAGQRAGDGRSADASPVPPLPPARRPGGGAKENFDLSTFYANEGALADSDNNLIPDRVDVLLSADGDGAEGVIDLGARLGLESTGVSLPIARTAKSITAPDGEPILVLIGTAHPVVDQLIKSKKWEAPALQPGEGLIRLVKKAFGEKSALIVTGGDAAGVARAVRQLAETFPHIWQRGKDRTTLDDVEEDVRKFVVRAVAGRAGGDGPLQAAEARGSIEGQDPGVGAREDVRRESRRRSARRRQAARRHRRSPRRR